MRRLLALLLATLLLCVGTVAFASNGEDTVFGSEKNVNLTSWGKGNQWGRSGGVYRESDRNISRDSAAFFLQLDGLQMDTSGNISGRPSELFTGVIATAKLADKKRNQNYAVVIGNGITEKDILAEVKNPPSDSDAFDEARGQLMYKGYIRSDKGEVIPWAKLNADNYGIEWYVFKFESDGWHIDGRILDLSTDDIIEVVIPENPEDIPEDAYKDDDKKDDKED